MFKQCFVLYTTTEAIPVFPIRTSTSNRAHTPSVECTPQLNTLTVLCEIVQQAHSNQGNLSVYFSVIFLVQYFDGPPKAAVFI